ncbi:sulfurtransferase [Nonomuraea insulae]|uniref:Sulfurtransferase n=1 Tax=Nonomuraea insulae TaxID=1616787 RepID=A0ABW1DD96_9ACTN
MPTPLIDVPTLRHALDGPRPPIPLDVRWALATGPDRAGYEKGHLPGARFVDMDADLADPPGAGGRHPLPAAERFTQAMRRAGVSNDTPVVCYDAGPALSAARAWWLLRHFGHADVRILDGGYAAWVAAALPVTTGDVTVPLGDFAVSASRAATIEAGDVLGFAGSGGLLLDARDTERYLGRTEPVDPIAGHIPGAVSAPTTENTTTSGTFHDPSALRDRFTALGASDDRRIAVYCGSGVTAAHQIAALEAAGYQAALYPGSWSHWITDPSRPVATDA